MTQRQPTRFPLLLLLALAALAGCEPTPKPPTPPAEQPYSEVQFDVTVPPETPVDASVFIKGSDPSLTGASNKGLELVFQGGNVFSGKTRLPKGTDITYTLHIDKPEAQVALDAAGAVVPAGTLRLEQDEENRALTVERWGPATGETQPQVAFLVQVPETAPTDTGFWLSGNAPELGEGKPNGVRLYRAMDSRYAAVLSFAPGTALSFKTTRGSVGTEETNSQGEDLVRTHTVGSGLERVSLAVGRWADDPSELTFSVTVPPESPPGTEVAILGSHEVLGGGVADKALKLVHQADNSFSAKVTVRGGEELSFSVWMTAPIHQVELDATGAMRSRTYKVRGDRTLNVDVEHWGEEISTSPEPRLAFVVSVPSNTPADADLYLSGNAPELGDGKPDGVKLHKTADGHYAAILTLAAGTTFDYQVTRGSMDTVEVNAQGEELAPHTFTKGPGLERITLAVPRWKDTPLELNFQVTVPPETPADAKVVIKGSHESFGGTGLELTWQSGTTFSARVVPTRGQEFTYGAWLTPPDSTSPQAALDATGAVQPERTFKVKGDATLSLAVDRWGPETGGSTEPRLVFVVAVPSNTPPDSTIHVVGNQEQIGGWNPGAVPLYKAVNGRYAIALSFAPETSLEYKVTRGSWGTVEKGSQGEEIGNRTYKTGSGYERTFLTVAKWADLDGVPATPVLTGNIEYLRDVTPTHTTLKKRDVIVWLPPDYTSNPTRRYPVLYMHDGQNLMDATTAFAGEWGVDETAQQLVESGDIEPVIIVGVYNTSDRGPEYTQVPDARYPEVDGANGGRADLYGQFLINELKPLIDGKYRTKPEAQSTGLAGSSLGGLVSMYLGMKYPGTFGRLGVISPSVFWGNSDIVTQVNALSEKLPLRIWLDIGTEEGSSSQETVEDTRALRDALVGKGWVLDTDLKYTEVAGGRHNEKAWAARFGDILKYLYPPVPAE